MKSRKTCPVCKTNPVAINKYRNGVPYYRSRCDSCIRHKKKVKPAVPTWVKAGYKKKDRCERCGFKIKLAAQATVYYVDGNSENADWMNLKTICCNCKVEVEVTHVKGSIGDVTPD